MAGALATTSGWIKSAVATVSAFREDGGLQRFDAKLELSPDQRNTAAAILALAVIVGQIQGRNPAFCRGPVGWILSIVMILGAVGLVAIGRKCIGYVGEKSGWNHHGQSKLGNGANGAGI